MPRKRLIETLESLRKELGESDRPNAETDALLAQVESQIRRLRAGDAVEPAAHSDFAAQLETAMARFEAEHPNLALLTRHVINALSAMGI